RLCYLSKRQMINSRCLAPCEATCPQPIVNAWNQPCVTSCGPILGSCPRESIVGSSAPSSTGSSFGSMSSLGPRGCSGSRILYNYGRSCSSYMSSGYGSGSRRPW
uniref:Keratin n=1 Tax=Athene cunicularia TaxID=194338 RepID=A0A663M414_ATHCN